MKIFNSLIFAVTLLLPTITWSKELPQDYQTLLNNAIMENITYDPEFNYKNIGKFTNLSIYQRGYHLPKKLVDHVVVNKSHYQMFLLKNGKVVRKYWIALSENPKGHKQYEGDKRTPEGTYTLDYIKEKSYYYRAFHISYPNTQDIINARNMGKKPGGLIMIHGQPPNNSEYHDSVQRSNWTNGCIAVLNNEMDEIISLVDPGTPITINP